MSHVTRNSTLLASIWIADCLIVTLLVYSIAMCLFTSREMRLRKVPSFVFARNREEGIGSSNLSRVKTIIDISNITRKENSMISYHIFLLPFSLSFSNCSRTIQAMMSACLYPLDVHSAHYPAHEITPGMYSNVLAERYYLGVTNTPARPSPADIRSHMPLSSNKYLRSFTILTTGDEFLN